MLQLKGKRIFAKAEFLNPGGSITSHCQASKGGISAQPRYNLQPHQLRTLQKMPEESPYNKPFHQDTCLARFKVRAKRAQNLLDKLYPIK